jgi:uncharacterized circularly permuted ATP-grasp superfamily protein/uncharacterized alpha-E superfamily protein
MTEPADIARDWLADYRASAAPGDVANTANPAWEAMLGAVAAASHGDLAQASARVQRQADAIGTGFRLPGDSEERRWPLSPLPLMIDALEWDGIAAGVIQRAGLLENLLGDIYGTQSLVRDGVLPPTLLNGSRHFLRSMVGINPPGGHHLHVYAADLGRGPDGEWRVLADHTRTPTGMGYALENRLAIARVLGGLQSALNIKRLATFFSDLRAGIAASCRRSDPRIVLLTPGRLNPSYAEQAHLARYLGMLLVEGDDLAVADNQLFLRTIAGFKRVDALWRRVDPRMLDPLQFDAQSRIGVPGLIDSFAAGNAVIANAPGAGVLEAPAFAAFMPGLSLTMSGQPLLMPNIATWWCGQESERQTVMERLSDMVIGPAFGDMPVGLGSAGARLGAGITGKERTLLTDDMARRPMDYVGHEVVHLSTMPGVGPSGLEPRPFTLRVFAARDASGQWTVMPGGFARLGDQMDIRAAVMGNGALSTDVCIHGVEPVPSVSLLPANGTVAIRRNPGTLPSRVADNLYWLGRYLERGESVLALVRAGLGGSSDGNAGASVGDNTQNQIATLLVATGATEKATRAGETSITRLAAAALDSRAEEASVATLVHHVRTIGEGSRERLSGDFWQVLANPFPQGDSVLRRVNILQERFAALAGLAEEEMSRTAAWHFHKLGRRIERAVHVCRLARILGGDWATADDLTTLLDLTHSQISYRQRYPTGLSLDAIRDLIGLDPDNPRALAYQVKSIRAHLDTLPRLNDDGLPEPQQAEAAALATLVITLSGAELNAVVLSRIEEQLLTLSNSISRRFFLASGEPQRASGLTFA